MLRRRPQVLTDTHLMRSKDVDEWYGDVMVAWNSLLTEGSQERWRNLGYWTPDTDTLELACRNLATRLADAARVRPEHDVLDVGCGLGESTLLLDRRLAHGAGSGSRLVGLDVTPAHIDAALARRDGDRPEFVVGSAMDLPFPAGSFDRVLALECTFHFPSRRRFIAEAHRVLRPNGVLAIGDALIGTRSAALRAGARRLLPKRLQSNLDDFVTNALKYPTDNLVDIAALRGQFAETGFEFGGAENISRAVFPYFRRYWHRVQDPRRQERELVAAGASPTVARERAQAWRRQMRMFMFLWPMSEYWIVSGRRRSG